MKKERILITLLVLGMVAMVCAMLKVFIYTPYCPNVCERTSDMFPNGALFEDLQCENLIGQTIKVDVDCRK